MNTLTLINDNAEIRLSLGRQSELQKICNVCVEKEIERKRDAYILLL